MAKTKATTKRSTTAKSTKPKKKKATTKKKTPNDEVTIDRRRTDRRSKKTLKADAKPKSKVKASTRSKSTKTTKAKRKTSSKTKVNPKTEVKAVEKSSVQPAAESPKPERRKVQRRRQIDPTTCERDYSEEEIEFMHALDAYKRTSGRMFPTCSEILEVVRSLGYIKAPVAETDAAGDSNQEPVENGEPLSDSSNTEPAVEHGEDVFGESGAADDLIIAPTDFSSSDSIDVNLLS